VPSQEHPAGLQAISSAITEQTRKHYSHGVIYESYGVIYESHGVILSAAKNLSSIATTSNNTQRDPSLRSG